MRFNLADVTREPKRSWLLSSLMGESLRRLGASPRSMSLVASTSALVFLVVMVAEILVIQELEDFRREEMWQGRSIVVVDDVPSSEQALLRTGCSRVQSHQGVAEAGGFKAPQVRSLSTHPGAAVRVAELEETTWQIWFPGSAVPSTGLAAGSDLVERVGLRIGDPILFEEQPGQVMRLGAIVGTQRPFTNAEGWLLSGAAVTEPVEQCWIEFLEPVTRSHMQHISAAFANLSRYEVRPVIRPNELTRDVARDFETRVTRWGPVAALFILTAMYRLVTQTRRGEQAVYTTVGLSRSEEYIMSLVETMIVVVLPGLVVSSAAVALYAGFSQDASRFAIKLALEGQLLSLSGALLLLPSASVLRRRSTAFEDLKSL